MKFLRWSAMAAAAALSCAIGCSGDSSSCSGTNINSNTSTNNAPMITCSTGYAAVNGTCVPLTQSHTK